MFATSLLENRMIGICLLYTSTVDLVNTSYGTDRIALSEEAFADLKRAKRQNYELIYEREGMVNGAGNIVEEMFEELYERLLDCLLYTSRCG